MRGLWPLTALVVAIPLLFIARQGRRAAEVRVRASVAAGGADDRWDAAELDLALYDDQHGIFAPTRSDEELAARRRARGARIAPAPRALPGQSEGLPEPAPDAVADSALPAAEASAAPAQAASSPLAAESAAEPRGVSTPSPIASPSNSYSLAARAAAVAGLVARPFLIFISGHAGSTWLCSLLASHPRIVAKGEIFNKVTKAREGLQSFWAVDSNPNGTHAAGFKARPWTLGRYNSTEFERAWSFMELVNTSIVCNCREMLSNAVSRARAGYRKKAEFYDQENGKWVRPAFDLPEERFMDALKGSVRRTLELFELCKRAAAARLPVLWVSYSALLERREATGDAVLRFLGLPPSGLSNSRNVVKYGSRNLNATVLNIDNLLKSLATMPAHARLRKQLAELEESDEYKSFCMAPCAFRGVNATDAGGSECND